MSKETKYTPGPWTTLGTWIMEDQEDGHTIASTSWSKMPDGHVSKDTARANAKLIAAAPELLKALQEAHKEMCFANSCSIKDSDGEYHVLHAEVFGRVQDAIANATK